jgi:hypothetical protein
MEYFAKQIHNQIINLEETPDEADISWTTALLLALLEKRQAEREKLNEDFNM